MSTAVLGGGLTGLSAAYYLSKKLPKPVITIYESTQRTGGWIKSNKQQNGMIFEQGPRTIRPRGPAAPNTLDLIEELGLTDQIVAINTSHPAAKNRLVYAKNDLHLLPSSIMGLFKKQSLFSKPLIFHLMKDLRAPHKSVVDESIYDFINRRFGAEVADYLISPLICGICAGNAKEISVNFLMKKLFVYEQEHGSISKGFLRNFLANRNNKEDGPKGLNLRAQQEQWSVYSFLGGCEALPLTLEKNVKLNGVQINVDSPCNEVIFNKDHAILKFRNQETVVDRVVSGIPAGALGGILQKQHPELADLLKQLTRNVTVAVINLHFKEKLIKTDGFGLLVAPKEKLPILGVIYDSCVFPRDDSSTVLTVMMGGHWFEEHFGENPSEEKLLKIALEQLAKIMDIHVEPIEYKVNILDRCLPQYVIGHNETLRQIENYVASRNLPLSLCGASYHGVGINDVILSAKNAIEKLS